MPPIHPDCQPIADEIQLLQQQIATLSADLHSAPPGQKPAIAAEIKKLNAEISAKRSALSQCMAKHPSPSPVTSTLSGTASIWFPPKGSAGTSTQATLSMTFSGYNLADVNLGLPNITFRDAFQFSRWFITYHVDVTVSPAVNAVGKYDSSSHHISIPLTLTLTYSISGFLSSFISSDPSRLSLTPPGLTTRSVSSNLSPIGSVSGSSLKTGSGPDLGKIKLVGAGVASAGLLNGKDCIIEISGILQPIP